MLMFLLAAGCERNSAPAASPPDVEYIEIKPDSIPLTKELSGRASAYVVSEVRPQVSGIIQARLFTEGNYVKAGDTLYQIDPAIYRAARARASASLKEAKANLEVLQLTEKRHATLVGKNAISRQEHDDTVAARKQAQARVALAEAELETATINLDYTRVTAPVSGKIGRSAVTPGALVTQNQAEALAVVQQIDPLYVDITESSTEYLRWKKALQDGSLRSSAKANEVTLPLDNGRTELAGTLEFEDITVDESTGTLGLRATFANPDGLLLPGMYVRVILNEGISDKAILVPKRAVSRNTRGEAVARILKPDETEGLYKVETAVVAIDRSLGNYWLIPAGLADGDLLVVEGFDNIRTGQPVKAQLNYEIATQLDQVVRKLQEAARAPEEEKR